MLIVIILLAIFQAITLSMMVTSFKPDSIRILKKLICGKNEKMEVINFRNVISSAGEKSIEIYCSDRGNRCIVNGKAFLLSFLFAFFLMLPLACVTVFLTYKFL